MSYKDVSYIQFDKIGYECKFCKLLTITALNDNGACEICVNNAKQILTNKNSITHKIGYSVWNNKE